MRIGFATSSVSRRAGGLFDAVRKLGQSMVSQKTEITVVGLQDPDTAKDQQAWAPLQVKAYRPVGPRQFGYSPGFASAMLQSDAELFMTHGLWMYSSLAALNWHNKTGRPYIVHPHGMLDPWAVRNSRWKKWLAAKAYESFHLRNAACIRALCQSEAEAIRAYGIKNPIAIIPNGIDLPADAESKDYGTLEPLKKNGKKVLLFLSRIHPKKGLVNLIKAWAEVQRMGRGGRSEWILAIAGWDQGGHEDYIKRLASDLRLKWFDTRHRKTDSPSSDSLVFLGPQFKEQKAQCYRACDAFILPSYSEGLPMVVLEAWAYAKPVLMTEECNLGEGFARAAASRIESTTEAVRDGLEWLSERSDQELQTIGANGRQLVMQQFTWAIIAAEMIDVCSWSLGTGSIPECVQYQ